MLVKVMMDGKRIELRALKILIVRCEYDRWC